MTLFFGGEKMRKMPDLYQPSDYCVHFCCMGKLLLMEEILRQLIGSLSNCFQGFIHPRWCRISSINSINPKRKKHWLVDWWKELPLPYISAEIVLYIIPLWESLLSNQMMGTFFFRGARRFWIGCFTQELFRVCPRSAPSPVTGRAITPLIIIRVRTPVSHL